MVPDDQPEDFVKHHLGQEGTNWHSPEGKRHPDEKMSRIRHAESYGKKSMQALLFELRKTLSHSSIGSLRKRIGKIQTKKNRHNKISMPKQKKQFPSKTSYYHNKNAASSQKSKVPDYDSGKMGSHAQPVMQMSRNHKKHPGKRCYRIGEKSHICKNLGRTIYFIVITVC